MVGISSHLMDTDLSSRHAYSEGYRLDSRQLRKGGETPRVGLGGETASKFQGRESCKGQSPHLTYLLGGGISPFIQLLKKQ